MVISYEECPLICHFPVDSRGWRKCGIGVHAPNPPLLPLLSCNGPFLPSRGLVREGGSRQSVLIQIGCIRGQSHSFLLEVRKLLQAVGCLMNSWVGVVQRIHRYYVDGICLLDVLNSPCKLAESTSPSPQRIRYVDINLRRVFTQTH